MALPDGASGYFSVCRRPARTLRRPPAWRQRSKTYETLRSTGPPNSRAISDSGPSRSLALRSQHLGIEKKAVVICAWIGPKLVAVDSPPGPILCPLPEPALASIFSLKSVDHLWASTKQGRAGLFRFSHSTSCALTCVGFSPKFADDVMLRLRGQHSTRPP